LAVTRKRRFSDRRFARAAGLLRRRFRASIASCGLKPSPSIATKGTQVDPGRPSCDLYLHNGVQQALALIEVQVLECLDILLGDAVHALTETIRRGRLRLRDKETGALVGMLQTSRVDLLDSSLRLHSSMNPP
jgi:hypothetical protein